MALSCSTSRSAESLPAALTRIRSGASAATASALASPMYSRFTSRCLATAPHWRRKPWSSANLLLGEVAPLATTGAPMASREPVRVTLVETMRCGLAGRVTWLPSALICRGQSAA